MRVTVHQFNGVATMNVLPLAAGLIVASAKMDAALSGVSFEICVDRLPPEQVVDSYRQPDVLAFSCYCWNAAYTDEVARRAKGRYPESLIVFGGPNVPRRPERIASFMRAHPHVDVLVIGEGEMTFRELLRARLGHLPMTDVAGIVVRDSDAPERIHLTAQRERIRDFTGTASPYLDGTFDELFERTGTQLTAAVCETNRGCPFSCTFCDWGQATESRVHELPMERVAREFDWIGARGLQYLYIIDANFGIRRRDIEIVGHLADVKRRTGVPLYCHFHLTKNAHRRNLATVETLREAGIGCQVALSMQDFDDDVLASIKRANISLEESLALRKVCNERGIPTYNELILGLPAQTCASFCDSLVKAITPYPGDSFYLYLCRVLENAEMAEPAQRERYGIQTRACLIGDYNRPTDTFDVAEREDIVVATNAMPNAEWRRAYRFGYLLSAFYNYRLLDVVIQYLRLTLRIDLRVWMDAILDRMAAASGDSVLAELDAVFSRYIDSIMSGGALVLSRPGDDSHVWGISDAVLATVLQRRQEFFDVVGQITRGVVQNVGAARHPFVADGFDAAASEPLIDELFVFQNLLVPGFDRRHPVQATFSRDWLQYQRTIGEAHTPPPPRVAQDITLIHTPPTHAQHSGGWSEFLQRQLAVLHARTPIECVRHETEAGSCVGLEPTTS